MGRFNFAPHLDFEWDVMGVGVKLGEYLAFSGIKARGGRAC
jgi:hypothetical protein